MDRVLVLDVVGLTPKLLHGGAMPRLSAYAREREERALVPDVPAVTCTVQASMLTGERPSVHGAVANGWYFRDLAEVWFWRQSAALLDAPTVVQRWQEQRPGSRVAQWFWWWNLPGHAELSMTPRPTYFADGRKGPDVHAHPTSLRDRAVAAHGAFPLFQFWGPGAGIASTRWIASTLLDVLERERPGLALAYLPHLDYDLQRFGPDGAEARAAAAAVDVEVGRLLDHAASEDIAVLVVSEYGITPVVGAVEPNRALRREGFLAVHPAANGALLDPGYSRAFAVCDHQCAHVYVADSADVPAVRRLLEGLDGVASVHGREDYAELGIDHPRSGELFLISAPDRWFAYPYWDGEDVEPDFARTVDIHRKPGYDPCELLLDPAKPLVKARIVAKLLGKKLNLRTLMDVIPVDSSLVKGSHGRRPAVAADGPVWIGPSELLPAGLQAGEPVPAARALAALPA